MNSFFLKDSLGSLANIFKKQGINAFSNFYGKSIGTLGSVISSAAAGQGLPGLDMNDFVTGAKVLGAVGGAVGLAGAGAVALGLPDMLSDYAKNLPERVNKNIVEPVGNILERGSNCGKCVGAIPSETRLLDCAACVNFN